MKTFSSKVLCLLFVCFLCCKLAHSQSPNKTVTANGDEYIAQWDKVNYVLQHKDITYKSIDSVDIKLDILVHKKLVDSQTPIVIYVHGGNWNLGNKSYIHRPLVEEVFQRIINLGYRVLSIDYRLCRPHTPVSTAISDVKDAVRWAKQNGAKYLFDTEKIVLMGTSAGAHISMMAAYSSDSQYLGDKSLMEYTSDVSGIINCYGPVEVIRPFVFHTGIAVQLGRWFANKSLYRTFTTTSYDFSGLRYPEQRKELRAYMHKHSVTSIENPRNIPLLTLHGTVDDVVRAKNAKVLHKYLDKWDIPNTLRLYRGVGHSFVKAKPYQMLQMCNAVENLLRDARGVKFDL